MSAAATVEQQAAAAPVESLPPAALPQSSASSSPPPTKPKRHYNRFRHSPERVKDFQRMLPRQAPRLRDLRIYESVVYDQLSQHDVAQIFDITQPRVCQIVQEVRAWLSTTPWELSGMTEQQQMNLATHETRRWLEVIRKKALASHEKTDAQCEKLRTVEDQRGNVHRERTYHNQPPTSGFLKVALQATIKAGELAGAGQQWVASRRQTAASSPQSPVHSPQATGDGPQSPVPSPPSADRPPFLSPGPDPCGRIAISDHSTPAAERVSPCGDNDLRPGIPAGSAADGLLKENRPRFSLEIGKANGHKTSVRRGRAQIVNSRRRKEREFAYRKVADRMGVGDEGRRYFFDMLRQLDGLAQRVDSQVQRRIRIEAKRFHQTHTDLDVAILRRDKLCEMLRLDHSIRTFPYGDEWVLQEYDATTGRFRWHQNGQPPAEKPPKPPDPTS